jgi:hypothetical protein
MREDQFVRRIKRIVKDVLPSRCRLGDGKERNLYYQIIIDGKCNFYPKDPKKPMRGDYAFQTDICILEKKRDISLPRVVIEIKSDISTHDVITYSNKALRHKRIYPYLRYGLLLYNRSNIPEKFFIHNEGIDFFLAIEGEINKYKKILKSLIKKEIRISKILESTISGDKELNFFQIDIRYKNLKI